MDASTCTRNNVVHFRTVTKVANNLSIHQPKHILEDFGLPSIGEMRFRGDGLWHDSMHRGETNISVYHAKTILYEAIAMQFKGRLADWVVRCPTEKLKTRMCCCYTHRVRSLTKVYANRCVCVCLSINNYHSVIWQSRMIRASLRYRAGLNGLNGHSCYYQRWER